MATIKMEAHRMNQKLDKIWRIGDKDIECAGKHIGWGTAALAVGLSWEDGLDYLRPWDSFGSDKRGADYIPDWDQLIQEWADHGKIATEIYSDRLVHRDGDDYAFIRWTDERFEQTEKALSGQWAKVVEVRDRVGCDTFVEVMRLTRYQGLFDGYLDDMKESE